jgi:hypothetical protein
MSQGQCCHSTTPTTLRRLEVSDAEHAIGNKRARRLPQLVFIGGYRTAQSKRKRLIEAEKAPDGRAIHITTLWQRMNESGGFTNGDLRVQLVQLMRFSARRIVSARLGDLPTAIVRLHRTSFRAPGDLVKVKAWLDRDGARRKEKPESEA